MYTIEFWPGDVGPDDPCRNPPTAICLMHFALYVQKSLEQVCGDEHEFVLRITERKCEECEWLDRLDAALKKED